jgi:hypothetical protein
MPLSARGALDPGRGRDHVALQQYRGEIGVIVLSFFDELSMAAGRPVALRPRRTGSAASPPRASGGTGPERVRLAW